jgi:hypothetical protein
MLGGMHLLGLSGIWSFAAVSFAAVSFAAVALSAFALIAVSSLIESKGDVGECLDVWRFAFFEGFEWLAQKFRVRQQEPDSRAAAKQLSDVLQIPLIDAELSMELCRAFFNPTGDPRLNSEAIELLSAPTPRNEAWRARASECCQRLNSHY